MTTGLRRRDIDMRVVAERYLAGESSSAIAVALGCSLNTVFLRLKTAGVEMRPVGTTHRARGAGHGKWKGDAAGYAAMHTRLRRRRGAPRRCEQCGLDDPKKRYEWANLSGRYEDIDDYARMCVPCHRLYDDKGMGRGAWRRKAE